MLVCICPNFVEYHQFERVTCENRERRSFLRSIDFNNDFFISLGFFLGTPDFFVILKAYDTYDTSISHV